MEVEVDSNKWIYCSQRLC